MEKENYESYTPLNKETIGPKKTSWHILTEIFGENITENKGIGLLSPAYIYVNQTQNKVVEYQKIQKFLDKYIAKFAKENNIAIDKLSLEFINYGQTELVFVLTKEKGRKYTLLVKQPHVLLGKVKQEAQYLCYLQKKDQRVVAPIDYFQLEDQELYVTPYINQARCIASDNTWGMYVPEPYYRFVPFTKEQERIVNACMIAKLISLYDFENKEGISSCKLGGGDFMLPKGWEDEPLTIENTLNKLYLIAAREKIKCSYKKYISCIKDEFARATICENQEDLKINLRGRVPMQLQNIDLGIQLSQDILKNNEDSLRLTKLNK